MDLQSGSTKAGVLRKHSWYIQIYKSKIKITICCWCFKWITKKMKIWIKKLFAVIPPKKKRGSLQQSVDTSPILKWSANTRHRKSKVNRNIDFICLALCSTSNCKKDPKRVSLKGDTQPSLPTNCLSMPMSLMSLDLELHGQAFHSFGHNQLPLHTSVSELETEIETHFFGSSVRQRPTSANGPKHLH